MWNRHIKLKEDSHEIFDRILISFGRSVGISFETTSINAHGGVNSVWFQQFLRMLFTGSKITLLVIDDVKTKLDLFIKDVESLRVELESRRDTPEVDYLATNLSPSEVI